MIGEATLAMLYVPLFFYIFDRWSEKKEKNIKADIEKEPLADGSSPENQLLETREGN